MKGGKIGDMERRLRQIGVVSITFGSFLMVVNLVTLILISGGTQFSVIGFIVGTCCFSSGALLLISARGIAYRESWMMETQREKPHGFAGWFTNKRNFTLVIILSFILTFTIGFIIIKAVAVSL